VTGVERAERIEKADASPYDLIPIEDVERGERISVLCLHGLTGTPYEVRPIAEQLHRQGLRARGVHLAGHGGVVDDLIGLPYEAWLAGAREDVQKLRDESDRVFAVGLSLGGLVTLALASEGLVDAAAVIGTPLRFSPLITRGVPFAKYVMPYLVKKDGSDIKDDGARARHPGFDRIPLAAIQQLIRLQRVVEAGLPRIDVPLLVAHGSLDRTANPGDAREIQESVASRDTQLHLYERSGHVVPVDFDGPALGEAVASFFGGL
jgi:carboxylesterase